MRKKANVHLSLQFSVLALEFTSIIKSMNSQYFTQKIHPQNIKWSIQLSTMFDFEIFANSKASIRET